MSVMDTNLHKFAQNEDYQSSIAQSNFRALSSRQGFQATLNKFKTYKPRSTIIDVEKLHQSPYLKLKKYKDSAFYGQIVNGKRHGYGVMLYSNDRIFQGQWQCDYKNGMGYEQFQNGCIYQGFYVNGKPEGVGKYQWPNGEFYEGQWLSGLKHGSGMWYGAKGDNYVGEWKFGKADGYGVHVWINGDRYEGEFKQCLKHGSGTERFACGEIYKGEFYKGKPNGYGEYYWPNGSYYKGSFKDGLKDGQGIWKLSSGNSDKYQGQYLEGKKHGYGIFTWYSGNIYKGNYREDEREGYGQMYWTDGSYYKGNWHKGCQEGEGIIFTPEEGIKKGIFKDNVLVEIMIEQQPVINVPVRIRKKRLKTKNLQSYQITPILEKRKKTPNTDVKKHVSLQNSSKSPQSYIKIREKFVKDYMSSRNNSNYSRQTSRKVEKSPQRVAQFKSYSFQNKVANDNQIKELTPIQEIRKEHVPHSSIYMHKIDKRRSALASSASNKVEASRQLQSSQNREIKPLTTQSSGRFNRSTIM